MNMTVNFTLRGSFNAPFGSRIEGSTLHLPSGDIVKLFEAYELNDEQDILAGDLFDNHGIDVGLGDFHRELEISNPLVEAIDNGNCVAFFYDGKPRTVEVHAVGENLFRGYQIKGESSRPLPCWALFSIDKIEDLMPTNIASQAPREGYRKGDKQINPILKEV